MEMLAHGIQAAIKNNKWNGIKLMRQGQILSHLFYANDLLLFTEAKHTQISVISNVLYKFGISSCQNVNNPKQGFFFSKIVLRDIKHVNIEFDFSHTNNIGK